jgi:hypothetical protein
VSSFWNFKVASVYFHRFGGNVVLGVLWFGILQYGVMFRNNGVGNCVFILIP